MHPSLPALVLALYCSQPLQADYQSANFVVHADTPEIAKLVAQVAEKCRKDLAKQWLNDEPRAWQVPCHVNVSVTIGKVAGFTDVSYSKGMVTSHRIDIQGPLDRLLTGLLPHELTHVLFAHYFGVQTPRWADEGGAIISEDEHQGQRQAKMFRQMLAAEKFYSLRRLLEMRQYPSDVACLYAEGHSLTRFLVNSRGRGAFLLFVKQGLEFGWDQAAKRQYGYANVEGLEKAWLTALEKPIRAAPTNVTATSTEHSYSAQDVVQPERLPAP